MDQLKSLLEYYFSPDRKIPYSILINGSWGVGKTWFIHNQLKILFPDKKIIYFSLNGIKNIDDLSNYLIFRRIGAGNPHGKKIIKASGTILSAIAKKYIGLSESDLHGLVDNINDYGIIGEDEVLVLDDLERISSHISIIEVLGYISKTLTESNYSKVVYLADEKEMKDIDNYQKIKEKFIWQTIDFKPDISAIFNDLIMEYKVNTQTLLRSSKKLILDLLAKYKVFNLRTIKYYFTCFDILLKSGVYIEKKFYNVILNSTLIYCIEYRGGSLTNFDNDTISYLKLKTRIIFLKETIDGKPYNLKEDEKRKEQFGLKYLNDEEAEYFYFESLLKLVYYGVFNKDLFTTELDNYSTSILGNQEWNKLIRKLNAPYNLNEVEFINLFSDIMKYVDEGRYGLYNLVNIAEIIDRHYVDGLAFPMDISDIYNRIINKIETTKIRHYEDSNFSYIKSVESYTQEFQEVFKMFEKRKELLVIEFLKENQLATIEKLKSFENISAEEFNNLLVLGDIGTMDLFTEVISSNPKLLGNITVSVFNRDYIIRTNQLAAFEKNIEYLIKALNRISSNTHILAYNTKVLEKSFLNRSIWD